MSALLTVEQLTTGLGPDGPEILSAVSLTMRASEVLGVVGESGSGKSMLALSIMGLLPHPIVVRHGRMLLEDSDLLQLSGEAMRSLRGKDIAMIFQEPMTSLNPVMRVGTQIGEVLRWHLSLQGRAARKEAIALLRRVEMPDPDRQIDAYPHELSGGMRQRVMIAMALAGRPRLLIADEPTTALDVTIQAQILELVRKLQRESSMSVMLITHDLGVIAETAQRVVVMYAGRKVEEAPVKALFARPRHPYTRGLMTSIPKLNRVPSETTAPHRLTEIAGVVPSLIDMADGCTFAPRCPYVTEQCRVAYPPQIEAAPGHFVACWNAESLPEMARV